MFDLLIQNGMVLDGTGSPALRADVAVKDGKIVRIARGIRGEAAQVIDATGLVVTPGFIDSHSHSDQLILEEPEMREKWEQGITTAICGQCGGSVAPISCDVTTPSPIGNYGTNLEICRTMGTFLRTISNVPQGIHSKMLVGHGSLRAAVMGNENRAPTAEELERMKELLREALEAGAIGMSMGLIYTPGCYAKTDEVIELAKIVGEYHGVLSSHLRNEGDFLVRSVEEFLKIVRESGARGVISHHKAMKKENWGKVHHTLRMIDEANAAGMEVYCDTYPYTASSTSLSARFIPKQYRSAEMGGLSVVLASPELRREIRAIDVEEYGEDLSWALVSHCSLHPEYEGLHIPEIAALRGQSDPYETVFDLLQERDCSACYFLMCEEDVETVLAHPRTMICTDSAVRHGELVYHPRLRGTFPRVLGRYVRERHVTTLPEMIRKMTSLPAAVYDLRGKGLVREGFDADLCIFNPDTILDHADYATCHDHAEGFNSVIVSHDSTITIHSF